jgi:hypothetical protein
MKLAILLGIVCAALSAAPSYVGVIDTVGGTTYDNQNSGPALQWLAYDPAYGIHVVWMYANSASNWPDRRTKYNFFDRNTGAWNWNDPDFMAAGTVPYDRKTGYPALELDPADGTARIVCHYAAGMPGFTPVAYDDISPGAGIFDECLGAPNLTDYFLPVIAMPQDGSVSLMLIRFSTSDNMYYTRATTWCTWDVPTFWVQSGAFGHNICASRQSNKLFASWMTGNNADLTLHYRLSSDGGANWDDVQTLTPPVAWGTDTVSVFYIGATTMFDKDDNWQLVATVLPLVADSAYQCPAQLWLYNSGTSEWHFLRRAESQSLAGEPGGNAAMCGRPSLGQNPVSGRLYCAWEEFDSLNVETTTGYLRADIWLSTSADGSVWTPAERLTTPDETSKRFPFVCRNCRGDSLAIGFEQDSVAGFNTDGVGAISRNPICVWRGTASGIEETPNPGLRAMGVGPTIVRGVLYIPASGAKYGAPSVLLDISGRKVATLGPGPNDVSALAPGAYFVREPGQGRTAKVLKTD